jgi:hypothetical protein
MGYLFCFVPFQLPDDGVHLRRETARNRASETGQRRHAREKCGVMTRENQVLNAVQNAR